MTETNCSCFECKIEAGEKIEFEPNDRVNVPALRKVVELAEAEYARQETDESYESGWYQDTWASIDMAKVQALTSSEPKVSVLNGDIPMFSVPVSCMTTGCIAGHAVVQAGGNFVVDEYEAKHESGFVNVMYAILDGKIDLIEHHAQDVLGLTVEQQELLFAGSNDIRTVRLVAECIAESAGDRL